MSLITLDPTVWQKPRFEEWSMNSEIGAYQPDAGEERSDEPFIQGASPDKLASQTTAQSG
jgi:hypothetical protein